MAQEPDLALIAELCENIDRQPPAIEARKLLVQHYLAVGWDEAAKDSIRELIRLSPRDEEIRTWAKSFGESPESMIKPHQPKKETKRPAAVRSKPVVQPASLPQDDEERAKAKQDLIHGLKKLRLRASVVLSNTRLLGRLQPHINQQLKSVDHIDQLQALAEGRITTALRSREDDAKPEAEGILPPQSVRAVAREMGAKSPTEALQYVVTDFSEIISWQRAKQGDSSDEDTIRDTLVKRCRALEAALPENSGLQRYPSIALMYMDHEQLKREYVNDETMLGDQVAEITRENFFASEDGYAWDMDELAQAITANGGVMRNPLSRQMFTPDDIRFIVNHPAGKPLGAMQVEQSKLKKGVRPQTIEEMQKLSRVLLEDMSADQVATRQAVDHFFAYLATLPDTEQKAVDQLRLPAKDTHTGQAYDDSIGGSIRDAKANKLCWHKCGDFIAQAAAYLQGR